MFRFTIRDVLWLTVVAAVGIGWILEYRNRGPQYAQLRRECDILEWKLNKVIDGFKPEFTIEFTDFGARITRNMPVNWQSKNVAGEMPRFHSPEPAE